MTVRLRGAVGREVREPVPRRRAGLRLPMRIIYTNLKEDDAGVRRSVRQLRVEFAGAEKGSMPEQAPARPVEPDPGMSAAAGTTARPHEAADAPYRAEPAPLAEGVVALRTFFIKKFVDTQTSTACGPDKLGISITI